MRSCLINTHRCISLVQSCHEAVLLTPGSLIKTKDACLDSGLLAEGCLFWLQEVVMVKMLSQNCQWQPRLLHSPTQKQR